MSNSARFAARLFRMDERTWERHASPWSVWSRVASLPLLLLAIWSHAWIGLWAVPATGLVFLWLWINPRLFPAPARTDTWSAKVTFGERAFMNRATIPVPDHHVKVANLLMAASGIGFIVALAGAVMNDLLMTVAGGLAAWFAKMWFCDRMVWLFDDMKDRNPAYAAWVRVSKEEAR
ncbi:DUF6653 family protein [Microvirga sp. 2MCAF35]|uniref:DUF6653 family protein n=1 Tax=Microvirga sp. 2MCAF35 TaxID=3232987 RepID=UPI003F9A1B87